MKHLERLCIGLGLSGLVLTCTVYVDSYVGSREAVAAFEEVRAGSLRPAEAGPLPVVRLPPVEVLDAQSTETGPGTATPAGRQAPVALLTIERLDVEVPVFHDAGPVSLNRGAGIVAGSALPGETGNIAVAAHRDSFFRPLKDIRPGDVIELQYATGKQRFQVSRIFITDPLDVSVLDATIATTLTLITCYPFHYVGFAPDRFIVRALPALSADTGIDLTEP